MAKWVILKGGTGHVEPGLRQNDAHSEGFDETALAHCIGAVEQHALTSLAVEPKIVGNIQLVLKQLLNKWVAESLYCYKGFVVLVWLNSWNTVIAFFGNINFTN